MSRDSETIDAPAEGHGALRWLGPLAALLVFTGVVLILHHQLARLHAASVFEHLRSIPRRQVLAALAFTAVSYWLLSTYEVLALAICKRAIPYGRIVFTSFIAYSFGHTLGFAAFTGAAIRFRLYATAGVSAVEVATVSAFCGLSLGIGLAAVSGMSLLLSPEHAASVLRLRHDWSLLVGSLLLAAVIAYGAWTCLARRAFEIRGWALRAPGAAIGLTQIVLGVLDLTLSAAVLWSLLPPDAQIGFIPFLGVYAAAVIAGILSHVPGGVGVFEAVILLTLPGVPADALLGSLLAYRAVYYFVPLLFGTLLFGSKEISEQRSRLAWAQQLASLYIAPVVPQVAGALTFLAGALLLFSGTTPAVDERLAFLDQFLPLAVLEVSHLVGSLVGLGLLVLARALFRRVRAAYHICVWLLVAGVFASLLKGLDFEEATVLIARAGGAHARAARLLPPDGDSLGALHAGVGGKHRRRGRHGGVDRMSRLRHSTTPPAVVDVRAAMATRRACCAPRSLVVVLGTAYVLLEHAAAGASATRRSRGPTDLERARPLIAASDLTVANAALTGDKRLLFSDAGDAFLMYQIAGRSWIALGDPVGARRRRRAGVAAARDLRQARRPDGVLPGVRRAPVAVRRPRARGAEDRRGGARAAVASFSLEGPGARRAAPVAPPRAARRRQLRGAGAAARRCAAAGAQAISDSWLAGKSTGEKRFSVGAFSPEYLQPVSRGGGARGRHARSVCESVDHGDPRRAVGRPDALPPGRAAQRNGLPVHRADAVGTRGRLPLVQPRHGAALGPGSASARACLASCRQLHLPPRRALL